jgi:hypothetical protein
MRFFRRKNRKGMTFEDPPIPGALTEVLRRPPVLPVQLPHAFALGP